MASIGHIEELNAHSHSVTMYLQQIELYVNWTKGSSLIGWMTHEILRDILSPTKPQEKMYNELVSALTKQFELFSN